MATIPKFRSEGVAMHEAFVPPIHPVRRYRHGHKQGGKPTRELISYRGMMARCFNANAPNFKKYGARGITVCDRWRADFVNFLEDMGRAPSDRHSIERIDNDGNYEPGNCRWATSTEQACNRRSSRRLTFDGKTMTCAEWSERTGISAAALYARLKYGWTVERALSTPTRKRG